jgi:hypothetical protein
MVPNHKIALNDFGTIYLQLARSWNSEMVPASHNPRLMLRLTLAGLPWPADSPTATAQHNLEPHYAKPRMRSPAAMAARIARIAGAVIRSGGPTR